MLFSFLAPIAAPAVASAPADIVIHAGETDPAFPALAGKTVTVDADVRASMLHEGKEALSRLGFVGEDEVEVADYLRRLLLAQVAASVALARSAGQAVLASVEYYDLAKRGNPRRAKVAVVPTLTGARIVGVSA